MKKLAVIISYLSDGALISFVVFFLFSQKYESSFTRSVEWTFLTLVFSTIIPFGVIYYFWKKNKVSSIHLDIKEERWKFFIVSLISAAGGVFVLNKLDAPLALTVSMVNYVLLASVMMLITFFWKISLHASTVSAFAMAIIMVFGVRFLWVYVLVLPVLWARYYLRKHTISQLIAGTFVAGIITYFTFSEFLR